MHQNEHAKPKCKTHNFPFCSGRAGKLRRVYLSLGLVKHTEAQRQLFTGAPGLIGN